MAQMPVVPERRRAGMCNAAPAGGVHTCKPAKIIPRSAYEVFRGKCVCNILFVSSKQIQCNKTKEVIVPTTYVFSLNIQCSESAFFSCNKDVNLSIFQMCALNDCTLPSIRKQYIINLILPIPFCQVKKIVML